MEESELIINEKAAKRLLIFGGIVLIYSIYMDLFLTLENINMTSRSGAVLVIIGIMIEFSKINNNFLRKFSYIYSLSGTFIWAYADLFFDKKFTMSFIISYAITAWIFYKIYIYRKSLYEYNK